MISYHDEIVDGGIKYAEVQNFNLVEKVELFGWYGHDVGQWFPHLFEPIPAYKSQGDHCVLLP